MSVHGTGSSHPNGCYFVYVSSTEAPEDALELFVCHFRHLPEAVRGGSYRDTMAIFGSAKFSQHFPELFERVTALKGSSVSIVEKQL